LTTRSPNSRGEQASPCTAAQTPFRLQFDVVVVSGFRDTIGERQNAVAGSKGELVRGVLEAVEHAERQASRIVADRVAHAARGTAVTALCRFQQSQPPLSTGAVSAQFDDRRHRVGELQGVNAPNVISSILAASTWYHAVCIPWFEAVRDT
jgi:hypothetical protein